MSESYLFVPAFETDRKASLYLTFLACFDAGFVCSENERMLCLSCLLKSCLHPQIYLMLPLIFSSSFTLELSVIAENVIYVPAQFYSVFSGVRVTRSLVLYLCFVDRCLSFCTFSFGHSVVCSSWIYGF